MGNNGKRTVINTVASETELEVGGEIYRLRYDFDAIAGFEEGTGINPVIESIPLTLYNLMCLLYAGLHAHHPDVTIQVVQSWFNEKTAGDLCKVTLESFYGSLPEKKAAKNDVGGTLPAPDGSGMVATLLGDCEI